MEYKGSSDSITNRQMLLDLYMDLIGDTLNISSANQTFFAECIKSNSLSSNPLPFIMSVKSLNEYFKTERPKTFIPGFENNTMDILVEIALKFEDKQLQKESLFSIFYMIQFIDDYYDYFMKKEYYKAIDPFLIGGPSQRMYAALLITYIIILHDNGYIERFIQLVPAEKITDLIMKTEIMEEGLERLFIQKYRPDIFRILASIFTEVVKNPSVSKDALECANIVFSKGFDYSLNDKYSIPSICARGICNMDKNGKLNEFMFGDETTELPDFILIASVDDIKVEDAANILKATIPFIKMSPIEFSADFEMLMEITFNHLNDKAGVCALKCIKEIIQGNIDSCMTNFIEFKHKVFEDLPSINGIEFLYKVVEGDATFNVLREVMRIVIFIIKATINPEDLEILLCPEIFELCARCTEIHNDEMLNNVVKALDLISVRCNTIEDRSLFLQLAADVDLADILSDIIDDLDESATIRCESLLTKIKGEDEED